jgi:membrane protein YdbS with pleckstrin-like domain
MSFLERVLADDETVVMNLRPHWKALIRPTLNLLLAVGVASFGYAAMPDGKYQGEARIALIVLVLLEIVAFTVLPYVRWRTTHFVVTTHRVIVRSGIIARHGRDVPLSRINDVTFAHTALERVFGCGTLVVESAGERGQVTLTDVPRVEDVQRDLYRLVEQDAERRRRELDR